jgi:hypothetical protein
MLNDLQFPPEQVNDLSRADLDVLKLPPDRQELVWRVSQYSLLQCHPERHGDSSEAEVLRQRLADAVANPEVPPLPDPEVLANHGFLSLVVRSDVRNNMLSPNSGALARANPFRAVSPLAAWAAYWNPWSWRHGNTWYFVGLLVLAVVLGLLLGVLRGWPFRIAFGPGEAGNAGAPGAPAP